MIFLSRTSSLIPKLLLLGRRESMENTTIREVAMSGTATEVEGKKMNQGCYHVLRNSQEMVVNDVPLLPPGGRAGFVSAVQRWRNIWWSLSSYVALAKGGLVSEHVLVLPVGHYAASTDAPQEVLEELSKFKKALRNYFKSKKQSCVIFERNFKSQHLQLQIIPLPETECDALRQAFLDHGQSVGIQLSEVPTDTPIDELAHPGVPNFMVEFDEGGSLFTRIKGRFPLQFGREVLASPLVLNVPHRVDWKACSSSKEEETATTRTLRQNFQPFDFTE